MFKLRALLWIWLSGWLWMQPALAVHQLDSLAPDHPHLCQLCAVHLDGKWLPGAAVAAPLPQLPTSYALPDRIASPTLAAPGAYSIRAPPR
ncbi:hypothetical protein [Aeromonas schubertii]|uniref:DUF2946 domain-containing protein n=1 Tax=Aeromonas schubertii TaxID=652 RepID=A0A0S2SEE6_9GAMM|nr:hypothetical protein [Aeromonas schubertii]ALP40064.1 hypothetical protein WL1483_645 [Aeromonas schubertii]MBZ6067883.1 hypothetical protein [Aeromonas schubertii]MBZ6074049.1 hypothetical protein [Aeromonas schubertii]QCG48924.1 hypothetical protein E2P79_14820 [Aeromonas schubertii]